MDATTAHELAEQYTGVENEDATVTAVTSGMFEGCYVVELTPELRIFVEEDGTCERI